MRNYNDHKVFVLLPEEVLDELLDAIRTIKRIQEFLDKNAHAGLGDFIPESQAQKLLGRKTTWFWNARKSGILKGRKVANRWYYKTDELLKLMEGGVN